MRELLRLAIPAGVSQSSYGLMMFTDRLLLSPLGKEAPPASMVAGFTAMLLAIFLMGLLTYITPLVAQYVGARQEEKAGMVVEQGFLLVLLGFPIIYFLGEWLGPHYFVWTGIPAGQQELALQYFSVINCGNIFYLFNVVMASFFSGIGATMAVMWVNCLGMLLNIPLSYYFIHYGFFGYAKGIAGSALGSTLSCALMSGFFMWCYARPLIRTRYHTGFFLRWNSPLMKKLCYFGSPSGIEMFLNFVAFSTFVALFDSYGVDVAAAATIAFNWDIIAFMPMWGISIGVMSLVGNYMGAREIGVALRVVKNGMIAAVGVMAICSWCFLFYTEELVGIFLPDSSLATHDQLVPLAAAMVKLVSIYCFAHAGNQVLGGALRAAGDTRAVMYIAVSGQWLMLSISYAAIRHWHWPPLLTWGVFVSCLFVETLLYSLRFFGGKWKHMQVV